MSHTNKSELNPPPIIEIMYLFLKSVVNVMAIHREHPLMRMWFKSIQ